MHRTYRKIARLVRTALMITLRPGSVSTISDALLAASVASATAIPISAFLRAGASFTPSPVIPHICFRACKRLTISYLCSETKNIKISKISNTSWEKGNTNEDVPGKTPAKPSAFSINSSIGKAAMDSSLSCPNKEEEGYMFVPIPKRRPIQSPSDCLGTIMPRRIKKWHEPKKLPWTSWALFPSFRNFL
ncbi:hypothetical protein STAS_05284 [Striga asiatica]|uniref:Uncharacterized protein n=1 Tax=Striga asiatica TaxID=4170 RepID=A0A5A7P989_STRAF|nr:hypothetical protein STAS_05284 [Striga asiatica]